MGLPCNSRVVIYAWCLRSKSLQVAPRCFTWQNHDVQQKSIGNALPTLRLWHPGPAHSCIAVLDTPTNLPGRLRGDVDCMAWHGLWGRVGGTDARTPTRHHGNNPPDQEPVPIDMILDGSWSMPHVRIHIPSRGGNVRLCVYFGIRRGTRTKVPIILVTMALALALDKSLAIRSVGRQLVCCTVLYVCQEDKNGSSTATSGRLDQDREGRGCKQQEGALAVFRGGIQLGVVSNRVSAGVTSRSLASHRACVSLWPSLTRPDFAVQDATLVAVCCVHTVIIDCRGTQQHVPAC